MAATNISALQNRAFGVSLSSLNEDSTPAADVCGPLFRPYLLGVSVIPGMVTIENLVFLFAVLVYRTKLKQNNVYTYVTSALVANVLTSLWAFYHFLNYYYGIESARPTLWWAFRKGMTAGFSLILCGNIGLLIYAIEDNTYMLGRLVSGTITSRSKNKLKRDVRWKKSLILITFAWIFPVAFGLLSMTPWNCTNICSCTLHLSSGAPLCEDQKCSRLYTPMSKTYLLCIVAIWLLECSFLLLVLCKSATTPVFNSSIRTNRGDSVFEKDGSPDSGNNNFVRKASYVRRLNPRSARSYRFPFILLGLFVCCTAPVMILFVLDWAISDFNPKTILVNFITPLPLLYCIISPILLTRRLAAMRRAVQTVLSFAWVKGSWNRFTFPPNHRGSRSRASVTSATRISEEKVAGLNESLSPV